LRRGLEVGFFQRHLADAVERHVETCDRSVCITPRASRRVSRCRRVNRPRPPYRCDSAADPSPVSSCRFRCSPTCSPALAPGFSSTPELGGFLSAVGNAHCGVAARTLLHVNGRCGFTWVCFRNPGPTDERAARCCSRRCLWYLDQRLIGFDSSCGITFVRIRMSENPLSRMPKLRSIADDPQQAARRFVQLGVASLFEFAGHFNASRQSGTSRRPRGAFDHRLELPCLRARRSRFTTTPRSFVLSIGEQEAIARGVGVLSMRKILLSSMTSRDRSC